MGFLILEGLSVSDDYIKKYLEAVNQMKQKYGYITPKMWDNFVFEDELPPPIPKPECDCGSKHTSFKNHHYHWCSTRQWEKSK